MTCNDFTYMYGFFHKFIYSVPGYKIVHYTNKVSGEIGKALVKLEIPPDTLINFKFGIDSENSKCRAEKAIVRAIWKIDKNLDNQQSREKNFCFGLVYINCIDCENFIFSSIHDDNFHYKLNMEATPKLQFDSESNIDCSSGIHFFLQFELALSYYKI